MRSGMVARLQNSRDVQEVRRTIRSICRPFGEVKRWQFKLRPGLLQCRVVLEPHGAHGELAKKLGGYVQENQVCIDIPVSSDFISEAGVDCSLSTPQIWPYRHSLAQV
jgi:hypothetical protein